jgi:type I restriction enzyme S subunit
MKDSELGEIPENFEVRRREAIINRKNSREDPTELPDTTPYVGLDDIRQENIALNSWGQACDVKSAKYRFASGDILFAKLRPYLHKCVFAPIDGIISTDAFVFLPEKDHYFCWALMHLSSKDFVDEATKKSTGTDRPRADWKALKKKKVPFPSDSLIKNFDDCIKPMTELIKNMVMTNKNLRQTRDLLLPRLMGGELDVIC